MFHIELFVVVRFDNGISGKESSHVFDSRFSSAVSLVSWSPITIESVFLHSHIISLGTSLIWYERCDYSYNLFAMFPNFTNSSRKPSFNWLSIYLDYIIKSANLLLCLYEKSAIKLLTSLSSSFRDVIWFLIMLIFV